MQKSILSFAIFMLANVALAQVDPSNGLLLKSGSKSQDLDSSRYELKPREGQSSSGVRVERTKPKSEPEVKKEIIKEIVGERRTPIEVAPNITPSVAPTKALASDNEAGEDNAIFFDDPRLNLVELEVAPGIVYFDSSSPSWYRNYFGSSPMIGVSARVWVTPQFGLATGYTTSLTGDITASPTSTSKVTADLRVFSGTMLFRNFASNSRLATSYTASLGFEEDQLLVPQNEAERIRLKNSSLILGLAARLPTALNHAYKVSVELAPSVTVKEESTQVSHSSGSLKSANGLRISFTSEFVLSRGQQLFWKLSHRYDKNIYEGSTSGNDPVTGSTLDGVSVQRGVTMFQIGFTWGD